MLCACAGDDGDDGADTPGGEETADGTAGTGMTDAAATMSMDETATVGLDSTGVDTDGPAAPTLCWTVDELGAVPGEPTGMATFDSDGDGSGELWVWTVTVNLSSTELVRFGPDGDDVQSLPGAFITLADFDGDGSADALMEDTPGVRSIYLGDGVGFDTMPIVVEAPGGALVGVLDLDGDGSADFLQALSENSLGSSLWTGAGIFAADAMLGVPAQASMTAYPAADTSGAFALVSQPSPGDKGCNVNRVDTHAYVGAMLTTSATGPMDMWDAPVSVVDVSGEGSPDVFVAACDTNPSVTNLRLLTDAGDGSIVESTVIDGAQWAVPADVDGDGVVDLVYGDETDMLVRLDFSDPDSTESTGVEAGTVQNNAVRVADLDGEGRQEILRASNIDGETRFDRIAVVDCE